MGDRAKDKSRVALNLAAAEMLAELAHELRQPLSAAFGALQVLRRASIEASRQQAVGVLERQFERLSRLVDDLSESTRTRLHKKRLRLERLDLRQLLQEAADAMRAVVAQNRQRLELDLPHDPVWIRGDWVRLHQVLSNVLINGSKFTPPGGSLFVGLHSVPGQAVLAIRDTGAGIPRALLTRVFDRYITGDDPAHGLGLGLTVAREIVELHGGTIRASSPGPGGGTEFVVTLPRETSDSAPDA